MSVDVGRDWSLQPVTLNDAMADPTGPLVTAIAMRDARRRRQAMFPHADALFHEPAWDMLLDLFVAEGEGRVPDFDALCAAANVRAQTAIRWITTLETLGLVQATAMPDARMPRLSLTTHGRDAMLAYLGGG